MAKATRTTLTLLAALLCSHCATLEPSVGVQLGPRPYYLVDAMAESPLKSQLKACENKPLKPSDLAIGHRGAPLQFPEHTRESYIAAARMGAGIVECDVTFTRDKVLVCRHSQCDLHTTTDILAHPELAQKCATPFRPADPSNGIPAQVKCCTSDITAAEFKTLKGKMDGANPMATTVADYMNGTPSWRTDLYAQRGTLMTHADSIALLQALGVKMTPELKAPMVAMPFAGMSQSDYAQKLIDEYRAAKVAPTQVYPQSFNPGDVTYWLKQTPEFGQQAVMLDGRYAIEGFDADNPQTWQPDMHTLKKSGINIIAPPLWMLLSVDAEDNLVPSIYAQKAREADLKIIAWTVERSAPLRRGPGNQERDFYYLGLERAIKNDGDIMTMIDVLVQEVGVTGIFSDWPATVSYYANCVNTQTR